MTKPQGGKEIGAGRRRHEGDSRLGKSSCFLEGVKFCSSPRSVPCMDFVASSLLPLLPPVRKGTGGSRGSGADVFIKVHPHSTRFSSGCAQSEPTRRPGVPARSETTRSLPAPCSLLRICIHKYTIRQPVADFKTYFWPPSDFQQGRIDHWSQSENRPREFTARSRPPAPARRQRASWR